MYRKSNGFWVTLYTSVHLVDFFIYAKSVYVYWWDNLVTDCNFNFTFSKNGSSSSTYNFELVYYFLFFHFWCLLASLVSSIVLQWFFISVAFYLHLLFFTAVVTCVLMCSSLTFSLTSYLGSRARARGEHPHPLGASPRRAGDEMTANLNRTRTQHSLQ